MCTLLTSSSFLSLSFALSLSNHRPPPPPPPLPPHQVRLLYCSLEEAELVFRAAWASGQAGPSHMWFAVGPALSGLGLEGLPKALFAIRPQGWRDEPRRYESSIQLPVRFFSKQFSKTSVFISLFLVQLFSTLKFKPLADGWR